VRLLGLLSLCLLCAACATTRPVTDQNICKKLYVYAASIPLDTTRTIRLAMKGAFPLDWQSNCSHDTDDKADHDFCGWLLANTSREFMAININDASSCLQQQKIIGETSGTDIERWSGTMVVKQPEAAPHAEIVFSYLLQPDYSKENFIQFEVTRHPEKTQH
jgi:hypothetical protein